MNKTLALTASLVAVFTIGYYADSGAAFAQYFGNVGDQGETGKNSQTHLSLIHI